MKSNWDRVAEVWILVVISLATEKILEMTHLDENIEMISPRKGTLTSTDSSCDAIEESVSSAAYIASNLGTQNGSSREDYSKYPNNAILQKITPAKSEVNLHVRSNARDIRLVSLHGNLLKNRQDFVSRGIVEVGTTQSFMIKMANWSNKKF